MLQTRQVQAAGLEKTPPASGLTEAEAEQGQVILEEKNKKR